ncbi:MAG: signal peptidase I [Chloroflexota bacterium]
MRRVGKAASLTVVVAVIVVWAFTLRPQALGGPAVFVAVRGSSMLPTYEHGDLVVVESAATYKVGEVVAYRVPAGNIGAGKIVMHRIIGGEGTSGWRLQGDHNNAPDPWQPRQADMVGVAMWRLPNAGRLIALVQQPVILAGLASGIVVTVFVARPPRPRGSNHRVRRRLAG